MYIVVELVDWISSVLSETSRFLRIDEVVALRCSGCAVEIVVFVSSWWSLTMQTMVTAMLLVEIDMATKHKHMFAAIRKRIDGNRGNCPNWAFSRPVFVGGEVVVDDSITNTQSRIARTRL